MVEGVAVGDQHLRFQEQRSKIEVDRVGTERFQGVRRARDLGVGEKRHFFAHSFARDSSNPRWTSSDAFW